MSARHAGFWVGGVPIPQGSKRIGRNRATKKPVLIDDNGAKLHPWRAFVAVNARQGMSGQEMFDCPVRVDLAFYMPRPAGHFLKSGELKPGAPVWCSVKPDIDKLERAVFDALTAAGVWKDDSRAVLVHKSQRYAGPGHAPGVSVLVTELTDDEEVWL